MPNAHLLPERLWMVVTDHTEAMALCDTDFFHVVMCNPKLESFTWIVCGTSEGEVELDEASAKLTGPRLSSYDDTGHLTL